MNPIKPDTGAEERLLAAEQPEYEPLRVALYMDRELGSPELVSRWTLSTEERLAIAEGADIFIGQLTFGHPLQPIKVQVGPQHYQLEKKG